MAIVVLASAGSALGASEWTLYEGPCIVTNPNQAVSCGSFGVFVFAENSNQNCDVVSSGNIPSPLYPYPVDLEPFPFDPVGVEPATEPGVAPSLLGQVMSRQSAEESHVGATYLVGLDFDSAHGTSTSYVSGEVAGSNVVTELVFLDDPEALDTLGGAVGDEHVVAGLCRILEMIEIEGKDVRTVNLSFGRHAVAVQVAGGGPESGGSPHSESPADPYDSLIEYGENCEEDFLSCQVSDLITYLVDRGVAFVAASGNHQEVLFPAVLENVLAVGALEMNTFFREGIAKPSWETPPSTTALMPGNGLCIRGGFAASAGSSYSSAMFAGWLAGKRVHQPTLDGLEGLQWAPAWSDVLGCYVVEKDGLVQSRCNDALNSYLEGLGGDFSTFCWEPESNETRLAGRVPSAGQQPTSQSFDSWIAKNHPTPESDPCVPCVGDPSAAFSESGWSDFTLNLSQSPTLPNDVALDAVYLRVGSSFYLMDLDPTVLGELSLATIDYLEFHDWGGVISEAETTSLVYLMRDASKPNCFVNLENCFWSATPILWPSAQ